MLSEACDLGTAVELPGPEDRISSGQQWRSKRRIWAENRRSAGLEGRGWACEMSVGWMMEMLKSVMAD
jgi:hypothetical protein